MLSVTRHPFGELRRELDQLFAGFTAGSGLVPKRAARVFPPLNIWEDGNSLSVEAEIPGVERENLEILAVDNELTIKGARKTSEEEGATYHRRDRGTGEFARVLRLPTDVDADRIAATLKEGVLTILLPKAEQAKAKRIAVKG